MADEKTKAQNMAVSSSGEPLLNKPTRVSGAKYYDYVKEIRRHPTIKLARELCIAPILMSPWSVESNDEAPEGAKEEIERQLIPLEIYLKRTALFGCFDYGWQPYEKVLQIGKSGLYEIRKVKPLLQQLTAIRVDVDNGTFQGFEQERDACTLDLDQSLLVNIDVEGANWYGEPVLESPRIAYEEWKITNAANVKYDLKIAGAHWIITYPQGKSDYNGVEGVNNYDVAQDLLKRLESSGSFVIPKQIDSIVDDMNKDANAWSIDLKAAYPTAAAAFIDRMKYLDALMVRGVGMPERSVLEGQFGTKAEAEAHGNFAITNMELRHSIILQHFNWHLVNHLLRLNYGPDAENSVKLAASPITDTKRAFLEKAYTAFVGNQDVMGVEADQVDMKALRESLDIPTSNELTREANDEQQAQNAALSFARAVNLPTKRRLVR